MATCYIAILTHGQRFLLPTGQYQLQEVPASMDVNVMQHAPPGESAVCASKSNLQKHNAWMVEHMRPMVTMLVEKAHNSPQQVMTTIMTRLYENTVLTTYGLQTRDELMSSIAQYYPDKKGVYYIQDQMQTWYPHMQSYPNKLFTYSTTNPKDMNRVVYLVYASNHGNHILNTTINLMQPPDELCRGSTRSTTVTSCVCFQNPGRMYHAVVRIVVYVATTAVYYGVPVGLFM